MSRFFRWLFGRKPKVSWSEGVQKAMSDYCSEEQIMDSTTQDIAEELRRRERIK